MFTKQLPPIQTFANVARAAGPFPASARRIVISAVAHGFHKNVVEFLRQFHPKEIFQSRSDFINRCDELELLIEEERKTPREIVRSS